MKVYIILVQQKDDYAYVDSAYNDFHKAEKALEDLVGSQHYNEEEEEAELVEIEMD